MSVMPICSADRVRTIQFSSQQRSFGTSCIWSSMAVPQKGMHKGVRKGREGWGNPLVLDILQALLPAQRRLIFFAYFLLVNLSTWCKYSTTEWICMQISGNLVNGPKSDNLVLVGICVIVCIQKLSHHFLQTFRPLRMFKIVFRNSSLYPKNCLFCLLRLSSASADPIGYITNFCSTDRAVACAQKQHLSK